MEAEAGNHGVAPGENADAGLLHVGDDHRRVRRHHEISHRFRSDVGHLAVQGQELEQTRTRIREMVRSASPCGVSNVNMVRQLTSVGVCHIPVLASHSKKGRHFSAT